MSELQESQRPNSASAQNGAGPAPKPNPSDTSPAVTSSFDQGISGATDTAKQPTQPYTPVFTTDKILESKAKKPREFFDEQNRKSAEKKKQNTKNRKKLIAILVSIVAVFTVIIVAWLVIMNLNQPDNPKGPNVPTVSSNSTEEVSKVQEYLQNVYNGTGNSEETNNSAKIEAADEAANEILNHEDNSQYADQIKTAQIIFYVNNGYYDKAIELSSQVNVDNLLPEQQATYYNTLSQAYYGIGDKEKADEYFLSGYIISMESGDNRGGASDE